MQLETVDAILSDIMQKIEDVEIWYNIGNSYLIEGYKLRPNNKSIESLQGDKEHG
jgi:hypothetical protein